MTFLKFHSEKGVSLLEVMVGMIVTAIGLLGLAPMIALSIDGNMTARDTTIASKLIKEKIEYFESLPADSLPAIPYYNYEPDCFSSEINGNTNESFNFTRATYLNDKTTDATIPDNLYELHVEIQWIDNNKVQRTTAYKTYLLKN